MLRIRQNCALEVSDIGQSHQGHLPRQKVSNSENEEVLIVPRYS